MEKEEEKNRDPFVRVVVGATSMVMAVLTYPLLSFRRRSGM